jgi:hypothetical protein
MLEMVTQTEQSLLNQSKKKYVTISIFAIDTDDVYLKAMVVTVQTIHSITERRHV